MTRLRHRPAGEPAVADIAALLRRTVFRSVPDETIESLLHGGHMVTFDAGTTVHAEDDAEGFGLVVRGLLRVYVHAGSGREVTVRYARSGALLGVPALIGGPPPVFVQALIPTAAFVFDVDRVRRIARDNPALAWAFASEAVERLYDVLEELAGNTFASVRQRVARHLLDLAASHASSTTPLTARVSRTWQIVSVPSGKSSPAFSPSSKQNDSSELAQAASTSSIPRVSARKCGHGISDQSYRP